MLQLQVNDQINLKQLNLSDKDRLFNLIEQNRYFLRLYLPWVDLNTKIEDTEKFLQECERKHEAKTALICGVFYENELAGVISLTSIDLLNQKSEIGYWLSEEYTHKGIIRFSCLALIDYAFQNLGLHRLEIRCNTQNVASQRIAEDLGFHQDGILRQASKIDDQFYDLIVYSLLAQEHYGS